MPAIQLGTQIAAQKDSIPMFTAPALPPEASRRSNAFKVLSGLGLGVAVAVLLAINLVLYLAASFFIATPEQLYHRTWNTVQERIYDPAVLKDWPQWEHKYDGKLKTDEDAYKAINEMVGSIGDRYTYFMDPKAIAAENDRSLGRFVGVGMVFGVKVDAHDQPVKAADGKPLPEGDTNGYPIVKRVIDGGSAKSSGLQVGDAITAVNGKDSRSQSLDQLIAQIKGDENTTVVLDVLKTDGSTQKLTLARKQINVPAVSTKHLPNDIGYLRLEGFDQLDATDEFKKGLEDLKDCKAIIIDLRGNPGGFVHNAINISSLFIEQGTVLSIRERIPGDGYETTTYKLTPTSMIREVTASDQPTLVKSATLPREKNMIGDRPVVVLVDGNSASASEMTTGALKDNKVVTVVGTKTFGKGIGQATAWLPNGTQLHVTSLRYYTPNGTWLGDGGNTVNQGIDPDITVPADKNLEFGSSNDNQLRKAIDVLSNKLNGHTVLPFIRTVRANAA
jgi:carboxyl-terminal processing protease